MIKLVIEGDPKTKKNNAQIFKFNNRSIIAPSATSIKYEKSSVSQIIKQLPDNFKTIDCPVIVKTVFYRKTKRTVDISNLFNAVHDILVRANVLKDDDWKIIESVDGSKIRFDKDNPRTEIFITKAMGDTAVSEVEKEELEEKKIKLKKKKEKEQKRNMKMKKSYELRQKGLTYKDISKQVGVSQSTASKYVKEYMKTEKDIQKK